MSAEFIEAVLRLSHQDAAEHATVWLEQQGLGVMPMQGGLLLTGSCAAFSRVFGRNVESMPRPARLPVPAAIAQHVEWIEVPRPRTPFAGKPSC
jgi:hypothetical protein